MGPAKGRGNGCQGLGAVHTLAYTGEHPETIFNADVFVLFALGIRTAIGKTDAANPHPNP